MDMCEHCPHRLLDNYGSLYQHPCEQCLEDWLELKRLVLETWSELRLSSRLNTEREPAQFSR